MSGHWHYVNGVLAESTIDNGDGTATHTTYNADGTVAATETVPALPVAEVVVDPLHQLAQAILDAETLDDVKPAAQAILTDGDQ
jgi:hypothetical protein